MIAPSSSPSPAASTQPDLFGADDARPGGRANAPRGAVRPADAGPEVAALAARLHARFEGRVRLGTSSWHFPGWADLVWQGHYRTEELSREGLAAYAMHPLMRCVSLDRSFYRYIDEAGFRSLAQQVPDDFRFVVKAPAALTDAAVRDDHGRSLHANPRFLDPTLALHAFVRPALAGLGAKAGVLVFQLSPPSVHAMPTSAWCDPLDALFAAITPALPPGCQAALEVRDPDLLSAEVAGLLRARGVRYVLGLHDRLPPLDGQLPMLRSTWPGDLVCRWNLHRGRRYADAKAQWAPFDRLQAPDIATRLALAALARTTATAGRQVLITVNNKAEGSAPWSVIELARAILDIDG